MLFSNQNTQIFQLLHIRYKLRSRSIVSRHRVTREFPFQRIEVPALAEQGARGDAASGEEGEHLGETALRADISGPGRRE